ncbi:sulfotransferase [Actinomadura sp. KC345]|uniref:sulfotransferase family protein n=1 Tax=Actinomadura sp. KC345 TaxID=2530371 RepID=UPI00104340CE|nr:sulfotransferase [Actinomadura sp. KC345]TDC50218.1 sulfotransferase [Actinomadura sp. KC345]
MKTPLVTPTFIMSAPRSGSTLLRSIMNAHADIRAPHELHLRQIQVEMEDDFARNSIEALGLANDDLEHLLWDRLLHWELARSGKQIIVEKTPANLEHWERLRECWPDARYIFLLRHPMHIFESLVNNHPEFSPDILLLRLFHDVEPMREARANLTGITVRYEELTANPNQVIEYVCHHLDVAWDPGMLDYTKSERMFPPGVGDWGEKIKSGRIHRARPAPRPEDVPEKLRPWCREWGYLD